LITVGVGGFWEVLFAVIRRHPIAEGFIVTSLIYALILPPNIPWWQVAVELSFGVVIGLLTVGDVIKTSLQEREKEMKKLATSSIFNITTSGAGKRRKNDPWFTCTQTVEENLGPVSGDSQLPLRISVG
jgi:hypothetical protein